MRKYLMSLWALLFCGGVFAQGEIDAIRLSSGDLRGTARGQAMGGAFGALGGDVTGIGINPAGLAVYRSSEVNVTMGLNTNTMKTNWRNTLNQNSKTKFEFNNASYVGYYPTGNETAPVLNFSFSYNRLKNFDRHYSASGKGMETSISDYIAAITKGIYYGDMNQVKDRYDPYANRDIPWLSTLGWLGFLINQDGGAEKAYTGLFRGESVSPQLDVHERGHIETFDLSLATHLMDVLYLGLTLGFTDIDYRTTSSYGENFLHGGNINLHNSFQTDGSGYQFTFGAIWRPVDFLRLGASFHSPVWYTLIDEYQGNTSATYEGIEPNSWAKTPDQAKTYYRFHTPYSWVFSVAGIFGTKAIASLDYEWKDYRKMKLLDSQGTPKQDANHYIGADFRAASTLRAGFEYRINPQLSARLGYSYAQNPYEKTFRKGGREAMIVGTIPHYTLEGDANYFTAGIGYRFTSQFYIDAAFVYRTQTDALYYFPLIRPDKDGRGGLVSTPASVINRDCKGLVTVGYKF
jgi:long-subunit fatty acid transport protein